MGQSATETVFPKVNQVKTFSDSDRIELHIDDDDGNGTTVMTIFNPSRAFDVEKLMQNLRNQPGGAPDWIR